MDLLKRILLMTICLIMAVLLEYYFVFVPSRIFIENISFVSLVLFIISFILFILILLQLGRSDGWTKKVFIGVVVCVLYIILFYWSVFFISIVDNLFNAKRLVYNDDYIYIMESSPRTMDSIDCEWFTTYVYQRHQIFPILLLQSTYENERLEKINTENKRSIVLKGICGWQEIKVEDIKDPKKY